MRCRRAIPGSRWVPREVRTITRWIDKGRFADFVTVTRRGRPKSAAAKSTVSAKDRQFWAFQKPVAKLPPNVKGTDRVRTPIDRFVLAGLESRGLTFSPDASKRTLLRRAYFDLTGLPPTPAQAREFLDDDRPGAWERLIDRLLASPHYGERWGRHWLDVVGYVDTSGKDFNPKTATLSPGYWRYRDYVIAATNNDTPWNRFLVEQIAGDELVDWRQAKTFTPRIRELLTATGFLRNVLDATNEDISNLPFDRYEALFKLMERVSSSTLGMTLACARCHSHKFDPIPQTDYYRFLSLFTSAYNPSDWLQPKQRFLYHVSRAEQAGLDRRKSDFDTNLKALNQQLQALEQPYRKRLLEKKLQRVPAAIRARVESAISTAEKKRNKAQKKLAGKYQRQLEVGAAELRTSMNEPDRATSDGLRARIRAIQRDLQNLKLHKIPGIVGRRPGTHDSPAASRRCRSRRSAGSAWISFGHVPAGRVRRGAVCEQSRKDIWIAPRVCGVADQSRSSPDRARHRESLLAAPLRPRNCRHTREFRCDRFPPDAPGSAGLARRRVSAHRMECQAFS